MRLRSVAITTYPTVEPVSLADAKQQLRLLPDQTDDDRFVVNLISAARRLVERRLGVALAQTQLRATFDNEEPPVDWRLAASFMPTLSIMSTQYRAALGLVEPVFYLPGSPLLVDGSHALAVAVDGVTVDPSTYVVDTDSTPGTVRFSAMPSVPAAGKLTITYWAGPADGVSIAPQLRAAILLMVGHLYVHREASTTENAGELPMAFETLLASESVSGVW